MMIGWLYVSSTYMPFPSQALGPMIVIMGVRVVRLMGELDDPRTRAVIADEFVGSMEPYNAPSWTASRSCTN